MRKQFIPIALFLLLTGCVSFAPTYSANIYNHLSSVLSSISKMQALVVTSSPDNIQYEKIETLFVEALSSASQAKNIAERRPEYMNSGIAKRPSEISVIAIDNCYKSILLFQSQFKSQKEMTPNGLLIATENLENACAIPRTMEEFLK